MNKNELYSDNTQTYCTHHKTVEVIDDFNTQSNKGKLEDKIIITAQMYILHGVTPGTDIVMCHRAHQVTVQEMSEDNYEQKHIIINTHIHMCALASTYSNTSRADKVNEVTVKNYYGDNRYTERIAKR